MVFANENRDREILVQAHPFGKIKIKNVSADDK